MEFNAWRVSAFLQHLQIWRTKLCLIDSVGYSAKGCLRSLDGHRLSFNCLASNIFQVVASFVSWNPFTEKTITVKHGHCAKTIAFFVCLAFPYNNPPEPLEHWRKSLLLFTTIQLKSCRGHTFRLESLSTTVSYRCCSHWFASGLIIVPFEVCTGRGI